MRVMDGRGRSGREIIGGFAGGSPGAFFGGAIEIEDVCITARRRRRINNACSKHCLLAELALSHRHQSQGYLHTKYVTFKCILYGFGMLCCVMIV